jgi:hypothetical protein
MSAVPRRRADRQDRPAEPLPASAVPIEEDSAFNAVLAGWLWLQ